MADVRPRLLIHHVLGDFVIDPWTDHGFDLSQYGVRGYEVQVDPETFRPFLVIRHVLGDFTLDPLGGGPPVDLSRYGINGYEIIFGVPEVQNQLGRNLLMVGVTAAFLVMLLRTKR